MAIIRDLYSELNKAEVRYVHFKSNTGLNLSFDGKGDFDVLVGDEDYGRMESILTRFGARKFETIKEKRYPYVCSWLFYDDVSGKLYHIHLHRRLVTGKEYVKDYIIPWHDLLLDSRVFDSKWNIYVTEPNLELVLLAARAVVKSKHYDWKNAKRGNYQLHKRLNKERLELREKMDPDKLASFCELLFPGQDRASVIDFCQSNKVDSELFLNLNGLIRKNLAKDRRMSVLSAAVKSVFHSLSFNLKKRLIIKYNSNIIINKVLESHRGLIVALVGVDGSGKSTSVKKLRKWFGSQIDSKNYFMGEGSGDAGKLVAFLKKVLVVRNTPTVNSAIKALIEKQGAEVRKLPLRRRIRTKLKSLILTHKTRTILRALIVVLVQQRNNKLLKKMVRYRRKGGVSITDRYPQMESPNMNDGLKVEGYLQKYPSSLVLKLFKKIEKTYMTKNVRIRPDIVFRLNISAQTSMVRKPEQKNIEVYQQKIDNLQKINFNNSNIIDINAEQPYAEVILLLQSKIWELLTTENDPGVLR